MTTIDPNNVQQRCGGAVRNVRPSSDAVYVWRGELQLDDGMWQTMTWTRDGRCRCTNETNAYDLVSIPTAVKPDINWEVDVEISHLHVETWTPFECLYLAKNHAYGYRPKKDLHDQPKVWPFTGWLFRNKPQETEEAKRVKGWVLLSECDGEVYATPHTHPLPVLEEIQSDIHEDGWQTVAIIPFDLTVGYGVQEFLKEHGNAREE